MPCDWDGLICGEYIFFNLALKIQPYQEAVGNVREGGADAGPSTWDGKGREERDAAGQGVHLFVSSWPLLECLPCGPWGVSARVVDTDDMVLSFQDLVSVFSKYVLNL